jgi:predicted ATP-dependent protease
MNLPCEIQPIGGVNEKTEGFFRVAKRKGLTGKQGVLFPHTNGKNLMLESEVVAAVKAGEFNVWSASTIEEGIELLTDLPYRQVLRQGRRTPGGLLYRVPQRASTVTQLAKTPA